MNRFSAMIALSMLTASAGIAHAQDAPKRAGCVDLSEQGPETQPERGPNSGTAPGGAGSSGWTGGLGGSDIGTSQQDEKTASPVQHPAVASGLDPIAGTTESDGPGMNEDRESPGQKHGEPVSTPC